MQIKWIYNKHANLFGPSMAVFGMPKIGSFTDRKADTNVMS